MTHHSRNNETFDVAILGTGLAGTTLGAILARHKARVLLIDAGLHPRFAVGESTIPYTSMLTRAIAERYQVPEIKALSSFHSVRKHVTTACGLKRNFGFVYHRQGKKQDPSEVNQFVIPAILHVENHFFRQDVDAYMLHAAVHYGAIARQETRIKHFEIDDRGVILESEQGEEFRARYLVDASGHASPVARQLGLLEEPTRFKHHARSVFTHMVGVRPYDEVAPPPPPGLKNPSRWHQGTLHHLFDGGWIWVIPFDNHPQARNPLCSVGLTVDPRVHPRPDGVSPEEEFRSFIARFPDIEKQFTNARSTREWVSTGRLQYSVKQVLGQRFCLTSHAAGFIDPLFSRGMTNTLEIVNVLAYRLLQAFADDDFSEERFEYVGRLQQGLLDLNDDVVYLSYVSFKDFNMWNACFRVWALGAVLGTFILQQAYARFCDRRDPSVFIELEKSPRPGLPLPDHDGFDRLVQDTVAEAVEVAEGRADPVEAGNRIFARLREADFVPPAFGFHDPGVRFYHPTLGKVLKTLVWSKVSAPPAVGRAVRGGLWGFMKRKMAGE